MLAPYLQNRTAIGSKCIDIGIVMSCSNVGIASELLSHQDRKKLRILKAASLPCSNLIVSGTIQETEYILGRAVWLCISSVNGPKMVRKYRKYRAIA